MQDLKRKLKKITTDVKAVIGTADNLASEQQRGIKSLVKRVKEKEIVVFQTDKSGRLSVDSQENYREFMIPHAGVEPKVSLSKHEDIYEIALVLMVLYGPGY